MAEDRLISIPHSLLINGNFMLLKPMSKIIYLYMLDYSFGSKTTCFPKSEYTQITNCEGFANAIKELCEKGFIEVKDSRKGLPNLYEFSEKWKDIKTIYKSKREKPSNFLNRYQLYTFEKKVSEDK